MEVGVVEAVAEGIAVEASAGHESGAVGQVGHDDRDSLVDVSPGLGGQSGDEFGLLARLRRDGRLDDDLSAIGVDGGGAGDVRVGAGLLEGPEGRPGIVVGPRPGVRQAIARLAGARAGDSAGGRDGRFAVVGEE